jgi:PAS domain-containing protein
MNTLDSILFVAQAVGEAPPEAGFFTWDVPENILYADGALANLFGLESVVASQGLPIEAYLDRVHPASTREDDTRQHCDRPAAK